MLGGAFSLLLTVTPGEHKLGHGTVFLGSCRPRVRSLVVKNILGILGI